MWTASNLNNLYSRADAKCAKVLFGKSPLFQHYWDAPGAYAAVLPPTGVWYVFRNDPESCKRLADDGAGSIPQLGPYWIDQWNPTHAAIELSKLEAVHIDETAGIAYYDRWAASHTGVDIDLLAIHFSLQIPKHSVGDLTYDIQLGYDPTVAGKTSYVRTKYAGSIPEMPPGRIHKHRLSVAEIAVEGQTEFRILNSYDRYDCWRIHNCGSNTLKVLLQLPDGSAITDFVAPAGCRSFRRMPNGNWFNRWPSGDFTYYFFPYLTGDVPYLQLGPGTGNDHGYWPFLGIEQGCKANNLGNPFVFMDWRNRLEAIHDPLLPYDIRPIYSEFYKRDPLDANTLIGDVAYTWGRARFRKYRNDVLIEDVIRNINSTNSLLEGLTFAGVIVTVNPTSLTLSAHGNDEIRISNIDTNIFAGNGYNDSYIGFSAANPFTLKTVYPESFLWGDTVRNWSAGANQAPTIFETISTLRKRIAVEAGFYNDIEDISPDVPEDKVSTITLTPLGMFCCAKTVDSAFGYDLYTGGTEILSGTSNLYTFSAYPGFSPTSESVNYYVAGIVPIYLQQVNSGSLVNTKASEVFPQIATFKSQSTPAIQSDFVPAGGPWGFSTPVFDFTLARVFQTTTIPIPDKCFSNDFWLNKWGATNGGDAFVRIPGSPNLTGKTVLSTLTYVDQVVPAGADDIFLANRTPTMARKAQWSKTAQGAQQTSVGIDGNNKYLGTDLSDIYTFDLPFYGGSIPEEGGTNLGTYFFHKIPKSAWLWSLLEWSVSGWTRARGQAYGHISTPVGRGISGVGISINFGMLQGGTGLENGGTEYAVYLTELGYETLIGLGVLCYDTGTASPGNQWWVRPTSLGAYFVSQGFTSFNLDCLNTNTTPNTWAPFRPKSPDEVSENVSYDDNVLGRKLYGWNRYVDLR